MVCKAFKKVVFERLFLSLEHFFMEDTLVSSFSRVLTWLSCHDTVATFEEIEEPRIVSYTSIPVYVAFFYGIRDYLLELIRWYEIIIVVSDCEAPSEQGIIEFVEISIRTDIRMIFRRYACVIHRLSQLLDDWHVRLNGVIDCSCECDSRLRA